MITSYHQMATIVQCREKFMCLSVFLCVYEYVCMNISIYVYIIISTCDKIPPSDTSSKQI